jgi:DNA-binding Xre family transcriptional regulator
MARARKLGYAWHLRMRMAEQGMFATTDLVPLLAERGVVLSAAQVYRLVTQSPERLSLRTLMALCNILDCTPNDLVEPVAEPRSSRATGTAGNKAAAGGTAAATAPLRARTPRRAEIHRDQ